VEKKINTKSGERGRENTKSLAAHMNICQIKIDEMCVSHISLQHHQSEPVFL
jgi:hypothetical protein